MEPQLKSDILLLQQDDGVWAYRTFLPQQDGEAWAYHLWEVLFRWSASRLDLEKFSGMLHVWESRMVLYVFNVPRLHNHSQQVDALQFFPPAHTAIRSEVRSSALRRHSRAFIASPSCLFGLPPRTPTEQ